MGESRFTETQVVNTQKQVEDERSLKEVCREPGTPEATYCN